MVFLEMNQDNLLSVLTTNPLEEREFQVVYIFTLLGNTDFKRKQNGSKLQSLS